MKARRQGQDLTTAQGTGPIPLGHTHKPTPDLAAVWVKGSRKDTRRKSLPAWWAWCSTMTFRPSTGGSFGPHLSFLTPGICSQWPQTHLAADLPDAGWLKHDHARGSPAFPLWEHEHDLLSLFFLPPRNTKGPFFPILLSASHKDKQEYLMAEGLRLFFERDHSLQVKEIIVWLTELNINSLRLVFLVISGTCGRIHVYRKRQTPRHPMKSKTPSRTHS